MSNKVILADAVSEFTTELEQFLGNHCIDCIKAESWSNLPSLFRTERPDVIIVDPSPKGRTERRMAQASLNAEMDATDIITGIRTMSSKVGIIVLSHSDDLIEKVINLELGADDYINKQAPLREIVARVRAVMRRSSSEPVVATHDVHEEEGGWDLRRSEHELYRPDGTRCYLTESEYTTLQALVDAKGEALSRDVLTETVFNRRYQPGDRAIDSIILQLRKKIEEDPTHPLVIRSARHKGYLFSRFPSKTGAAGQIPTAISRNLKAYEGRYQPAPAMAAC